MGILPLLNPFVKDKRQKLHLSNNIG